jgi:hypothetical protein
VKPRRLRTIQSLLSVGLCLCGLPAVLWPQQNLPHLGYIYPAGGRQGAAIQATVSGQFLLNPTDGYVSGSGVRVTVGEYGRPLNGQQLAQLRERLQELQKQGKDAAILKEMAEIRARISSAMRRNSNPALAESVTLQIAIAADAAAGQREFRLATQAGLSNPVIFCIGQLPEYLEPLPQTGPEPTIPEAPMGIPLPATINGRIIPRTSPQRPAQQFTPGDSDRFRFRAVRGQNLVIAAHARQLMPYLADAVPGWFQAVLTLYDSAGKEVAYNDDFRFQPDPVLHYLVPRDGEYVVEIRDALYRGREDFVYRIDAGELPFITSIFPLGGRSGAPTRVGVQGWNLPANVMTIRPEQETGLQYAAMTLRGLVSNSVPFALDTLPEMAEREPNDSQKKARKIKLPVVINGRIDRPGDQDVFRFEARAGDRVVAEVWSRRLGSPVDSFLRLADAKGRQLAFNDDFEDEGSGLETHHADSRISAALPAKGTYYLFLSDAQRNGGPEYAYRLRLGPPRPDFEIRVVPSSLTVSAGGGTIPVTAYALRKDGFAGEIRLQLKGAPPGFTLSGGRIPAGQDRINCTLTNLPLPPRESLDLTLEGTALIDNRTVIRRAVPADDRMQAFAYHHLLAAKELKVAVARRGAFRAQVLDKGPLKLTGGAIARLQLRMALPPTGQFARVDLELNDPPDGISVVEAKAIPGGMEVALQCERGKVKPGVQGNLILNVIGERAETPGNPVPANRRRVFLGTVPAVSFEIH